MKTKFKERLFAGMLILTIMTPISGFADPGAGGDKGQHGGSGGDAPSKPAQPAPAQPAPVEAAPAPEKPAQSGRNDGGNGDGAEIAAGIEIGGALIKGITHLIKHADQTKVVSYNWVLASDSTLHCFGINKYGSLANNKSVIDTECSGVPEPVTYSLEQSQDGTPACYEIYTPTGAYMNGSSPVEDSLCQ